MQTFARNPKSARFQIFKKNDFQPHKGRPKRTNNFQKKLKQACKKPSKVWTSVEQDVSNFFVVRSFQSWKVEKNWKIRLLVPPSNTRPYSASPHKNQKDQHRGDHTLCRYAKLAASLPCYLSKSRPKVRHHRELNSKCYPNKRIWRWSGVTPKVPFSQLVGVALHNI